MKYLASNDAKTNKKYRLAYNTECNLYGTNAVFDFWIWMFCSNSDRIILKLPFKLLNVKKIKSPETTMSNSIHKAIEAVGNEQPFQ